MTRSGGREPGRDSPRWPGWWGIQGWMGSGVVDMNFTLARGNAVRREGKVCKKEPSGRGLCPFSGSSSPDSRPAGASPRPDNAVDRFPCYCGPPPGKQDGLVTSPKSRFASAVTVASSRTPLPFRIPYVKLFISGQRNLCRSQFDSVVADGTNFGNSTS